jgi:hypothetical protein
LIYKKNNKNPAQYELDFFPIYFNIDKILLCQGKYMNKPTLFCLLILIFLGVFACSKKNEQQQNINAENLQQLQEQEKIEVYELFFKQFGSDRSNNKDGPVYIFLPGKYNILGSSVNIHSQPNLTSSVISKLELHSEIEINKKPENFQTIEGMTHYWYEIEYEDITGYIWGGFISKRTEIFEIDGKKIYCYYRVSKINPLAYGYGYSLVTPNDVFIYINQNKERIDTSVIKKVYLEDTLITNSWNDCIFQEEEDGNILLGIVDNTSGSFFIINKYGEIIFVENIIYGG